ncbi:MAG: TatD family hydrolase [Planctomycetota bacterium]|jgi:TatD DNase family protein
MKLIDTHCHLTFEGLIENVEAVIGRSIEAGVTAWINVGTELIENRRVIEVADRFDNLYAALGIHPHEAKNVTADTFDELQQLAKASKVVAIGETGLDYYYDHSPHADQARVFAEHLRIAKQLNMPVIIHSREAFEPTIDILDRHGKGLKVVFHCFTGSAEQARLVIRKGWHISFTGVVTFKNANALRAAAKEVPLQRLMLETDCPYMSPEPMRNRKINEPALMVHTAKLLADLKHLDLEDFTEVVTETSKNFFSLPKP